MPWTEIGGALGTPPRRRTSATGGCAAGTAHGHRLFAGLVVGDTLPVVVKGAPEARQAARLSYFLTASCLQWENAFTNPETQALPMEYRDAVIVVERPLYSSTELAVEVEQRVELRLWGSGKATRGPVGLWACGRRGAPLRSMKLLE